MATGTFTLTGGGTPTGGGTRHAVASTAVEMGQLQMGIDPLGPQLLTLPGGGTLAATGGPWTMTLSGGGTAAGTGRKQAQAGLTLPGGGNLYAGDAATATIALPGGGALTLTGAKGADATVTLGGGGALTLAGAAAELLILSGGGALTFTGLKAPSGGLLVPCTEIYLDSPGLSIGVAPTPPPADLVLTLLDASLDYTPSVVVAFVGNGTPNGTCEFAIGSGTPILNTTFDETGAVAGISVPVHVSSTGSYQLVATDITTSLTAAAPFTVAAVTTAGTIGVPVTTPPVNVQPGTGVKKWVFQDPASTDVHHFAINPSKMNSPFAPKKITFAATTAIDGQKLAFEGMTNPVEWQWEGVIFTKSEYDTFNTWMDKRNRIWVTDHFGRAWLCYLTNFQPVPRRDHARPWCHDYTMTALIFEGPVTPT